MSKRALAVVVLLSLGSTALAQGNPPSPVVVNGRSYASWTEYFLSDEFRANGLRCGPVRDRRGSDGCAGVPG